MRIQLLLVVSLVLLQGCAQRFGHRVQQSIVHIDTEPAGHVYYIASSRVLNLHGLKAGDRVSNENAKSLLIALETAPSDIANGSGFRFNTGKYVLVIQCGWGYVLRGIDVMPGTLNKFVVQCDA